MVVTVTYVNKLVCSRVQTPPPRLWCGSQRGCLCAHAGAGSEPWPVITALRAAHAQVACAGVCTAQAPGGEWSLGQHVSAWVMSRRPL